MTPSIAIKSRSNSTLVASASSLEDEATLSRSPSSGEPVFFWEWKADHTGSTNPYHECPCDADASRVFYRLVLGAPVAKGHASPKHILIVGYAHPQYVMDMAMMYPLSFLATMLPMPLHEFVPNCKQYPLPGSTLPFPDGSFDLVVHYGFIHDGPRLDWSRRLTELHRVLKNGGTLEIHEPMPYLHCQEPLDVYESYADRLNAIFDAVAQRTVSTSIADFNQHISSIIQQNRLGCVDTNMQLAVPLAETGGCIGNLAYVHYTNRIWTTKTLALRLGIVEDAEFDQVVSGWQQQVQQERDISLLFSVIVMEKCSKPKLSLGERLRLVFTPTRHKAAHPLLNRPCKLHH